MLKGKTAVVTGGSRGIGKAICLKFAENGADIAFLYAGNTVKAEETVKELEGLGVKAKAYQCNVADADAVAAVVKEIVKDFGGIQILVNNAGVCRLGSFLDMSDEDRDFHIDINIKGRHDPIIVPRAVVVVESMVAVTIVDLLFQSMTSRMDNIIKFFK